LLVNEEAVTDSGKDKQGEKKSAQHASDVTFSSFVMSLGMQALMQMGEMPGPDGAQIERDREAASRTIELLAILWDKTEGNLDQEESRLLKEILHNVRMAYVRGK
jgi:hypothetical protein